MGLAAFVVALGFFAGTGAGTAGFGRRQRDAGAASFAQSDGDGLLRRADPVLAVADMLDFFFDEFARCGRRRFALAQIFFGPLHRCFFRHRVLPSVLGCAKVRARSLRRGLCVL